MTGNLFDMMAADVANGLGGNDRVDVLHDPEWQADWKANVAEVPEGFYPIKGQPFTHQALALQEANLKPAHAWWIDAGGGKAQPMDAKILTPSGWIKMGDIKVGDQVVGSDGRPCNVTGVYPQGKREVCRVHFSDGASTTCCDEHLWQVTYHNSNGPLVLPLLTMMGRGLRKGRDAKYQVPVVCPIEFPEVDLPLDPYLLGVLIGDGSLVDTSICISAPAHKVKSTERAISKLPNGVDAVPYQYGDAVSGIRLANSDRSNSCNPLTAIIRSLDLRVKSPERFIPEIYKFTSIRQRLDILHGLMDTDGSCHLNRCRFHTMSQQLADDVQQLVRSLGGTARMSKQERDGEIRLSIKMTVNPFWARADDWAMPSFGNQPRQKIQKVTREGVAEMQCISVDAPDRLYVTDDYILTHNTLTAIAEAGLLFKQKLIDGMIIVAPNGPHRQWILDEIPKWADFEWHGVYRGMWKRHARPFFESERIDKLGVIAINYEGLSTAEAEKWIAFIRRHYPRYYFVIDESQKVKSQEASRTILVDALARSAAYRRTLSGTPLLKGLEDLFAQYYILEPGITGDFSTTDLRDNWYACRNWYCEMEGVYQRDHITGKMKEVTKRIGGYRNEDEFRRRVRPYSTRITEDMFGKETSATFIEYPVVMSSKQASMYASMKEMLVAQISTGMVTAQNALVQLGKLSQLASGFIYDDAKQVEWVSDIKVDATCTILEGVSGDAIIWAPDIPMLDRLEDVLSSRFNRVHRYRSPDSVDKWKEEGGIMIGNQGSGLGVGMNLQNAAANIYVRNSFSSEARWQSLKRTDRIGQTKQVRNWDIIAQGTVDIKALASLARKEEIANLNVNGLKEIAI